MKITTTQRMEKLKYPSTFCWGGCSERGTPYTLLMGK